MSCFKIEFSMPSGTPFRRLFAITSAQAIRLQSGETDESCSFRRSKSRIESRPAPVRGVYRGHRELRYAKGRAPPQGRSIDGSLATSTEKSTVVALADVTQWFPPTFSISQSIGRKLAESHGRYPPATHPRVTARKHRRSSRTGRQARDEVHNIANRGNPLRVFENGLRQNRGKSLF
jgi:hypothetical protein